MMSCFSSPQGVWAQIVAHAPSPEVEELASMIGVHMINTNEVCDFLLFFLYTGQHVSDFVVVVERISGRSFLPSKKLFLNFCLWSAKALVC